MQTLQLVVSGRVRRRGRARRLACASTRVGVKGETFGQKSSGRGRGIAAGSGGGCQEWQIVVDLVVRGFGPRTSLAGEVRRIRRIVVVSSGWQVNHEQKRARAPINSEDYRRETQFATMWTGRDKCIEWGGLYQPG